MSNRRRWKGLQARIGSYKRRQIMAVGFAMLMGTALLAVGYLWVEAQKDRRALGVYTSSLPRP
jgi:type VI protein secretion system component VasF